MNTKVHVSGAGPRAVNWRGESIGSTVSWYLDAEQQGRNAAIRMVDPIGGDAYAMVFKQGDKSLSRRAMERDGPSGRYESLV